MISVAELKQMIYKESGYKIQVQDNDPILTTFYVNLATLGEALKHAEHIQRITKDVINSLPGAADLEMQRAGEVVMRSLSAEVGRIAHRLAGDSASAEKAHAISFATQWVVAGVITSALVFGGVGYSIRMLADEHNLNSAQKMVDEADARVVATEQRALNDIEEIKRGIGWQGTEEGQLAKAFFRNGAGRIAATCAAPTWEIRSLQDGQYCVPKRRPLIGGNDEDYGWKIP
ncbi:MAG: hypothetical protein PHI29_12955 [Gallionella sp.]|nr:hypothetical protein [Gallionella sp.]